MKKKTLKKFNNGDEVTWTSHSTLNTTTKSGVIVHCLAPGDYPYRVADRKFPELKKMFDGGLPIKEERYIVKVFPTPRSKPKLYCPIPSKLKLIPKKEN